VSAVYLLMLQCLKLAQINLIEFKVIQLFQVKIDQFKETNIHKNFTEYIYTFA
jgi:hypothetical protein